MPECKNRIYVDYLPLSMLRRAPRNPKGHDLGSLDRSFARFGYVEPIAINEKTGRVMAGHDRLDALEKKQAAHEAPPARIMVENGEWLVPVLRGISFESDAEAEAYLLASNPITIAGGWQDDELAKVLADLQVQEDGLEGLGFTPSEVSELLRRLDAGSAALTEDLARATELQRQWQTTEHQIWRAGAHRVYCGNCAEVPAAFFEGRKIHLVCTAPLWGVSYGAKARDLNEYKRLKSTIERDIANDHLEGPELRKLFAGALKLAAANAVAGCVIYVMAPAGDRLPFFISAIGEAGFTYKHSLVWLKNALVMGRADYHYRHKLVPYGWIENGVHCWLGGRDQNSVFAIDRPTNSDLHPTTKPVELIARMIRNSSRPGDLVYDPFAGSGTALIAGHQLKRTVYAVEQEPRYVAVQL